MFTVKERFKLSEKFLAEFDGQQPSWGPLGYVTFKRTYARVIANEDGSERWQDAGYFLLPFIVLGAGLWSRKGWMC